MFINFKQLIAVASALSILLSQNLFSHEYSLEEKVGQLLIVSCPQNDTEDTLKLIHQVHVGGFIYYSWLNPLTSKNELKNLSEFLQNEALKKPSHIPLYLSIDQEGGVVSRLSKDFTLFPGNFAIGKSENYNLCLKASQAMAKEMRFAGINLNFAPVVDVIDTETIPYIGFRSFGSCPKKVTKFAKTMLEGFHQHQLLGTLKHFPGHGSAKKDSHVELPVIDKSLEDLKKFDLVPFMELKDQADFIMTAHVLVPCLDPVYPVTISEKALSYLKETMKFQGLVVSDSLTMEGLLKQGYTLQDAAIRAFNAGCDLLLIGGKKLNDGQNSIVPFAEIQQVHSALVNAVQTGIIPEKRLDQVFDKIMKNKEKLKLKEKAEDFEQSAHQKISESIAKQALYYHFKPAKETLFNHYFLMTSKDMQRKLTSVDKDLDFLSGRIFFDPKNSSECEAVDKISDADLIIFLSQGLRKHNEEEKLYRSLIEKNKSVFLIDLSEHEQLVSKAVGIIQTNNPQDSSLELAISKFKQELRLNN